MIGAFAWYALPLPEVAFDAVCTNVNVVDVGEEATVNTPLKEISVTPEILTVSPAVRPCEVVVMMVTMLDVRDAPVPAVIALAGLAVFSMWHLIILGATSELA